MAITLPGQHSTHGGAVPSIPPVIRPATMPPANAGNASAAATLRYGWADFATNYAAANFWRDHRHE